MTKKSQITVYFLLALILAISYGLIAHLRNSETEKVGIEKISNVPFEISPIKTYIENCIENTGKNALLLVGKQGGYYKLKNPYLKDDNFNLPYYIYNHIDFSPSIKDIENEISKYVDNRLESCINNFEEFKMQAFNILSELPKSNTNIGIDSILIDLNYPIEIQKGDRTYFLNAFKTTIDLQLSQIINVSKDIVNFQLQNPNSVCLSCLYSLADENNLSIDIVKYSDHSLLFEIRQYDITEDSIIKSPYNFTFAIKLLNISCDNFIGTDDDFFIVKCVDEIIKNSTQEIQIEEILNFQVKINEQFYYKVNAIGNKLVFNDFSELFNISNNGTINFTTNLDMIGDHSTWISIKDVLGNEKFENFNIEVIE